MHTAKSNSITIEPPPLTGGAEAVYYFHSDHLGSASWITDGSGLPVQHLLYLPFGEHFVNEQSSGYFERFTFTGKERDLETGYYYHGARFNSSDIGWLSVDPMSDKYPSMTPYNYCAWNPVKLVDPEGKDCFENDDGWKIDKQNKTITRVHLYGDNNIQFVEGDGASIRYESRDDLLKEYNDFTVIDNVCGEQLNSVEERTKNELVSPETVLGTFVGLTENGCKTMSKAIFDKKNGTYMGMDGSTKIMKKGKNGGLNGRYKSQRIASAKYLKAGRVFTALGIVLSIHSMKNTEEQFKNGEISKGERWANHAIDVIGCTPVGCLAPITYELGKEHGPSTWFNK